MWATQTLLWHQSETYSVLRTFKLSSTFVPASFLAYETSICIAWTRWSLGIRLLCARLIFFHRSPILMLPPMASWINTAKNELFIALKVLVKEPV